MNRILIIGSPGAGKTTLAGRLARQLDLPLVHLDKLFWQGKWEQTPRQEFDAAVQTALEQPRWIIDGNYIRTLSHRLSYCDTVIWLDFSAPVCLWGVTKRLFQNLGRTRPDMGGQCVEKMDKERLEFFRYVATFNKHYRARIDEMLDSAPNVNMVRFKNRRQLNVYLKSLENTNDF